METDKRLYSLLGRKATYPLSPNFGVSFSDRIDMPEPDFPLPVIQLDFDADIPWVLGKRNSYIDE